MNQEIRTPRVPEASTQFLYEAYTRRLHELANQLAIQLAPVLINVEEADGLCVAESNNTTECERELMSAVDHMEAVIS